MSEETNIKKPHSVKLPTQYRAAIKIARKFIVEKASVKTLLYNEKHARVTRLNSLLDKFLRNRNLIEEVISQSEILKNEPRFDAITCGILVTELLLGHENALNGESKPIQTILAYRDKLWNAYNDLNGTPKVTSTFVIVKMGKKNKQKKSVQIDDDAPVASNPLVDDIDEDNHDYEDERRQIISKRPMLPVHRRQEATSLMWLLFFSFLMFTLPFCVFYGVRHFLQTYTDFEYFQITSCSVLASVIAVNLIVAAYAYKGYHETEYDDEGNVIDQKKFIYPQTSQPVAAVDSKKSK